jgi:hypothetical protein
VLGLPAWLARAADDGAGRPPLRAVDGGLLP